MRTESGGAATTNMVTDQRFESRGAAPLHPGHTLMRVRIVQRIELDRSAAVKPNLRVAVLLLASLGVMRSGDAWKA
jgi:hypothetical protein